MLDTPTCNRFGASQSAKEMMAEILAMASSENDARRKMALETAYWALFHKVQSRARRRGRQRRGFCG